MLMRIKLDLDDRLAFSTVTVPTLGLQQRTLIVKVGGKAFSVWHSLEPSQIWPWNGLSEPNRYMQEIDVALVAAMEQMLSKLLTDACAAVPEGTSLL